MFNFVDWSSVFLPDAPFLEIIVRGSVMYLALFIMLRIVLKRQAGTLGMTDLLLITLLARNGGRIQVIARRRSAGRDHYFLELSFRLADGKV